MEMINVQGAPDAIGPYCHAMKTGNLVFCSGQTPLDPETMKLVGTTIEEQTKRVLDNISIVLAGLGLTHENIVKTTVFLKDMNDLKGRLALARILAFPGRFLSFTSVLSG